MNASSIMIPISDCPRVAEHRTIFDAVVMLEAWRRRSHEADYRLRVVLVYDDNHMIVGNLRAHGILHALSLLKSDADKTDHPADHATEAYTSTVFDRESLLWTDILTHLHEASHRMTVKDAMYRYHEAELSMNMHLSRKSFPGFFPGPIWTWLSLREKQRWASFASATYSAWSASISRNRA